jgi:hypothetical protein
MCYTKFWKPFADPFPATIGASSSGEPSAPLRHCDLRFPGTGDAIFF